MNDNDKKSQLAEMQWQTETLRRNEIKALERSVKMIEAQRAQLETHFAQSSDIVPFLDTVEGLAFQAGAKAEIASVNILENHAGLYVGMEAAGTFNGLYKFLTLLENSPYELEFVAMDLQKEVGPEALSQNTTKWKGIFQIKLLSFVE